jgi:3-methyl-2-oxobutanoate hydroxymethyltransferase
MIAGVSAFAKEVRERRYPQPEHGYQMAPDEAERLRVLLDEHADDREPFTGGPTL